MRNLESNEWILLSDIILKIHTADDNIEMRQQFLNSIRLLVPFDAATFYLAGEENPANLRNPVTVDCPTEVLEKYLKIGTDIDYSKWIYMQNKNMVYRDTDLYPDQVREELPYYLEFLKPYGGYYSAQMSLAYNQTFVGAVALGRSKEDSDFSDKELFALDILKDHLAYQLYMFAADENLIRHKFENISNTIKLKATYKLTDREIELVDLLFKGVSNLDAAEHLNISLHTVKKHLLNIYRKAGVTSRLQLFFLFTSYSEQQK